MYCMLFLEVEANSLFTEEYHFLNPFDKDGLNFLLFAVRVTQMCRIDLVSALMTQRSNNESQLNMN